MTSEAGGETSSEGPIEEPAENTATAGQAPAVPEAQTTSPTPQVEGRRTQLKVVRESVNSLSNDVNNFRRSHEANLKRLEAQVASLRKELSGHATGKDLAAHDKNYQAANKKIEKQVAALHDELNGLKQSIARDAARARAKQEATLAKILAKVSQKPKAQSSSGKKKR